MAATTSPGRAGALPWIDVFPARGMLAHGVAALALLVSLNGLIAFHVPPQVDHLMRETYLIFFYHFPAALNTLVFYAGVLIASICYLATRDPAWDRRARSAGEVGLLCNAVLLVTGSTWAKVAWGHFWIWDDWRLLTAAVMTLTYLGYIVLQTQVDEPARRRTFAAVYGIVAFANVPLVHFAIRWFGSKNHPMKIEPSAAVQLTRWLGVLAFFVFYLLVYRWRHDRLLLAERTEGLLHRVRHLEERRFAT